MNPVYQKHKPLHHSMQHITLHLTTPRYWHSIPYHTTTPTLHYITLHNTHLTTPVPPHTTSKHTSPLNKPVIPSYHTTLALHHITPHQYTTPHHTTPCHTTLHHTTQRTPYLNELWIMAINVNSLKNAKLSFLSLAWLYIIFILMMTL